MDAALKNTVPRHGLLMTALAPVLPQIAGSWFNIWYNREIVEPLLGTQELAARFLRTIVFYNVLIYPLAVAAWIWVVYSLRQPFTALLAGERVDEESLDRARRRVIHLPWF